VKQLAGIAGIALLMAALFPSLWLAWESRDMPHLGAAHDDAIYWVSAKSLAQDFSYRTLSSPGAPFQTLYPPLYPALLAVVWRIDPAFPQNLPIATLLNWSLLPLFVILSVLLFRESGLGWASWPLGALIALTPIVVLSGLRLMSELLFCVLLLATVLVMNRAARTHSTRLVVTAGLLAGLAFLAKTAGIALVLAGAIALAIVYRQLKHAALLASVSAPFILGWTWWVRASTPALSQTSGSLGNYSDFLFHRVTLGQHLELAAKNCVLLCNAIAGMLIPNTPWRTGILDIAALAGAILIFRRRRSPAYAMFALIYIAVLIVWPYPPDIRLAMPLLPLLVMALAAAVREVWRILVVERKWIAVTLCAAGCLALAVMGGILSLITSYVSVRYGIPQFVEQQRKQRDCDQVAYHWVRTNTRPSDNILADRPPVLYLYTGRAALSPILPPTDWYQSEEYRVEDWLSILPQFTRSHQLEYAFLCNSDLSAPSKAKAQATFRAEGWTERAVVCDGCSVYQIARER
jgi:hypothetical protein